MKIKFGIEVECLYNTRKLSLNCGSYHRGTRFNDLWEIQSDCSINGDHKFDLENGAEFVSKVVEGKKGILNAFNLLKEDLIRIGNSKKMNDLIYFNRSCGTHIHFSIKKYKFWDRAPEMIYPKVREYFFKALKENEKISDETAEKVMEHYNRSYSRIREQSRQTSERYSEWNFQSERNDQGLEWRSFNLNGAKTWVEMRNLLKVAYKTIKYFVKLTQKWEEPEEVEEYDHKPEKKKNRRWSRINLEKKPNNKTNEELNLLDNTDEVEEVLIL